MKIGLVVEGGGMKCAYHAAILNAFLNHNITFVYCIGASDGSGNLDGTLRMIEEDRYCVDISNQLLATQALLKRVNQEILRAHIRGCVREGLHTDEPNPKLEEALQLLEKLVT